MIKTNIDDLLHLLQQAKEKGCKRVKLQLYDTWESVEREQQKPSLPIQDYQFDVRYYNTVEFAQVIENHVATDKLKTAVDGETLILHVEISDMETLMESFGLNAE